MKEKILNYITKCNKKKIAIISGISMIFFFVILTLFILNYNTESEAKDTILINSKNNNREYSVKEVKNDEVVVNKVEVQNNEKSNEDINSEGKADKEEKVVQSTTKGEEEKQQTNIVKQIGKTQQSPKQTTYISNNFKLAIDFPANWENKYTVVEDGTNLMVCLKNVTYGDGLFFLITNDLTQYDNGNHLDRVGGRREVVSNGVTYTIGAYPGMSISDEDPNFQLYMQLSSDVASIVSTIRAI